MIFTTSDNGQAKNKTAYRWNGSKNKWVPYYLLTVTTIGENQIYEFALWNNKENGFFQNKQITLRDYCKEHHVKGYSKLRIS